MRTICCALLALAAVGHAAEEPSVTVWGNYIIVSAPDVSSSPELRARLDQTVTVDFVDINLTDAITFLRRVSGVNFVIGNDVRANDPVFTLQLKEVPLSDALTWIRRLTRVDYHLVDEAVFFTNERIQGSMVTKLYDVSDQVMPIRDFAGPELSLSGAQAGGGAFNVFEEVGGNEPEFTTEDLADIIRDQVIDAER